MEDKRVTAEEIMAEIDLDVRQMAKTVADAIRKQIPFPPRFRPASEPSDKSIANHLANDPTESGCCRSCRKEWLLFEHSTPSLSDSGSVCEPLCSMHHRSNLGTGFMSNPIESNNTEDLGGSCVK